MANVLIVSKEPRTAELAALICKSGGHQFVLAENAVQALLVLDERPFDIILADLSLARFCAHALARLEPPEGKPNGRLPIIAMGERGERVGGLAELGIGVVVKPLQPDGVRAAMMAALVASSWVEIVAHDRSSKRPEWRLSARVTTFTSSRTVFERPGVDCLAPTTLLA